MVRLASVVLCAAALVATDACARGVMPCSRSDTCSSAEICSARRCVSGRVDPAIGSRLRREAPAREIAVVSERVPEPADTTSITFGSQGIGDAAVFLRFDPVWSDLARVDSAFVVLDPLAGTPSTAGDVPIDAWRVLEGWTRRDLGWNHKPDLGHPHSRAIARSAPPAPLYVDVTEWARYAKAHPDTDHGIALAAGGGPGPGASFSTGLGTGAAPMLEVYGD